MVCTDRGWVREDGWVKMVVGFVLIITKGGKEHDVYTALKSVPEVVEHYPLFGEYDIIAKIHGKDMNAIGMMVIEKIRTIDGVMDTKTLTGIDL